MRTEDFVDAFPHGDYLSAMAAMIHGVEGSVAQVRIDIFDGEDPSDLCTARGKLLIITEGKTDARYLSRGLRAIAPEYADELQFLDYAFRPSSGGTEVATFLKALAAAGASGATLVLLDNDTAGHRALRTIDGLNLPPNFLATTYPDLDIARDYPTIGPTGPQRMDVNGSACSIEMYFGPTVLSLSEGLSPIRWKGFDDKLGRYQGEVSAKAEVQKRIETALDELSGGSEASDTHGLRLILDRIIETSAKFELP